MIDVHIYIIMSIYLHFLLFYGLALGMTWMRIGRCKYQFLAYPIQIFELRI